MVKIHFVVWVERTNTVAARVASVSPTNPFQLGIIQLADVFHCSPAALAAIGSASLCWRQLGLEFAEVRNIVAKKEVVCVRGPLKIVKHTHLEVASSTPQAVTNPLTN